jgi:hypothetical protein
MDNVYLGLQTLGQIKAGIGAVIVTIVGILLIVFGFIHLSDKSKLTGVVTATVVKSDNNSMIAQYEVNGIKYSIPVSDKSYPNSSIQIYYDPNNPSHGEFSTGYGKWLIIGGFIAIAISWLVFWLTLKFKFFAAAEGTMGALNLIR